jgi:hypothetical protein
MSMKRDAFPASAAAVALSLVMVMVATAAVTRAAPPQEAPTRKAADETEAGEAQGDGKDKGGDKGEGKSGDRDKDKAGDSGRPACLHCGATCGLTPICVCERGTKKKTRIEFESRCEPVCVAGCGGPLPRVCCTDCRAEPCACPGRVRVCNRLRAHIVTEEVPAVIRKVRYVCRCCEATCDGPPRHPHRWHWTTLLPWWPSWPIAYGSNR